MEIIDFKTGSVHQEKKDEPQEVKEERQNTISFLKELIESLEKANLDPEDCVVMVSYKDNRDKIFHSESHDIFHSDMRTRDILGLMDMVKHRILNDSDRT